MANASSIAFHWDMITDEHPEWKLDKIVDQVAKQAECTVAEVAEYMEDRLHEIDTRGSKKRRAQLAL